MLAGLLQSESLQRARLLLSGDVMQSADLGRHLHRDMLLAGQQPDQLRLISPQIRSQRIRRGRPQYLRVSAVALSEPAAPALQSAILQAKR